MTTVEPSGWITDATENVRREMLADMPGELADRLAAGEEVWDTAALGRDFEVVGFAAPLVVVRRKSDGATGSLKFTHRPRYYFDWQGDA